MNMHNPPDSGVAKCALATADSDLSIVAIIPLYNGARWIERSLKSALNQTLPPDEIIIVDDGSTDDGAGADIVRRFQEKHSQITLLHKQNGGQSAARNFAVTNSKSNLIAFLDQDDYWYPHHLEELARPFRKKHGIPLGIVYSNFDEIDEKGRVVQQGFFGDLEHKKHCSIVDCITRRRLSLPSTSMISREAYENIGGFDERLMGYEDNDIFIRIFAAGFDHLYLPERLSQWRGYPSSSQHSERCDVSAMIYARKLIEMFPDNPKQGRFYARDVTLPHFLGTLRAQLKAPRTDAKRVALLHADMLEICSILNRRPRIRMHFNIFGLNIRVSMRLRPTVAARVLATMKRSELIG